MVLPHTRAPEAAPCFLNSQGQPKSTASSPVPPPGSNDHLQGGTGPLGAEQRSQGSKRRHARDVEGLRNPPSLMEPDHRTPSSRPAQSFQPGKGQVTTGPSDRPKLSIQPIFIAQVKNWKLVFGPSWPWRGFGRNMAPCIPAPSP